MESNTYKIKLQKLKGSWTTYGFIIGIAFFFVNKYIGLGLILIDLVFFLRYKKDPENTSALYYNLGINLYNKKEINKAKQALKASISYNKLNKDAYFFLGCIFFDEKDYTNALSNLKQGGVDEIKDPSLIFVLGRCYYHEGNYEKAINYLEMITYDGMESLENERLFTLGRAYAENEEYEKALVELEKIKMSLEEIKGDSLEYCYYLAISYYNTDNIEKAREYIHMVCEVDEHYKYIDVYAKEMELI